MSEAQAAAAYLAARGLIEVHDQGAGDVSRLRLTRAGVECVESYDGGVARYLDAHKREIASFTSGQARGATGSRGVATLYADVTPEVMAGLVRELLQTLPRMRLEPLQRASVQVALEEAEREAQRGETDSARVRWAFGQFAQTMIEAGPGAFTQLMLEFAKIHVEGPA